MKKINNKFRNNAMYSLNYKFDSISSAGKISGTALELIKKYNELAKEAHSNGNYVEMEVFRQYAEHYRKIVTEINERKNQAREVAASSNENEQITESSDEAGTENSTQSENIPSDVEPKDTEAEKPQRKRRKLAVIEVSENTEKLPSDDAKPRKRIIRRKNTADADTASQSQSSAE
jgi:hypothetical protein